MLVRRIGVKALWRDRVAVGLSALMLGTAFSLSLTAFAIFDAASLRPFLFAHPSEVFALGLNDRESGRSVHSVPRAFVDQWHDARAAAGLVHYKMDVGDVRISGGSEDRVIVKISDGSFAMLGLRPTLGRDFRASDGDDRVAVISFDEWKTGLGRSPDVLDTTVQFKRDTYTVIGVAPENFKLPGVPNPSLLLLADSTRGRLDISDDCRVLIRTGGPPEPVRAQLEGILADSLSELSDGGKRHLALSMTPVARLSRAAVRSTPMFAIMIGAILLLAWINVAHVVVASFIDREKTFAIYLALGATRWAVYYEIAVHCVAIAGATVGSAMVATEVLLASYGNDLRVGLGLARAPVLDSPLVAAAIVGTLAICLALTIVPALRLRRISLTISPEQPRHGGERSRRWLVATQLGMAGVLLSLSIVSAGVFLRLTNTDLGMDATSVLLTSVSLMKAGEKQGPADRTRTSFAHLERAISGLPGVVAVGTTDIAPFVMLPQREVIAIDGKETAGKTSIRRVSHEYFETLRIPLVTGRSFTADDMAVVPTAAIVSEGFARSRLGVMDPRQAIGRRLAVSRRPEVQIVGVAKDVRDVRVDLAPEPTVYLPYSDPTYRNFAARSILVRTTAESLSRAGREVERVIAPYAVSGRTSSVEVLGNRVSTSLRAPRLYAWLTGVFGWVALILATIGTNVIVSYVAIQRRYSTAVRIACGATRSNILRDFARFAGLPAVTGVAVGVLGGVMAAETFAGTIYRDAGLGSIPVLVAILTITFCSGAAILIPAWRCSNEDPSVLLRSR